MDRRTVVLAIGTTVVSVGAAALLAATNPTWFPGVSGLVSNAGTGAVVLGLCALVWAFTAANPVPRRSRHRETQQSNAQDLIAAGNELWLQLAQQTMPPAEAKLRARRWGKAAERHLRKNKLARSGTPEIGDDPRPYIQNKIERLVGSILPLELSEVRMRGLSNWPFSGRGPVDNEAPDPICRNYGTVNITNLHPSRSVNLELFLVRHFKNGGRSTSAATPKDSVGREIGVHGIGPPILRKHQIAPECYYRNPIQLKTAETLANVLVFLEEPWDVEHRTYYIFEHAPEQLIIKELVSGISVTIPLPTSFRGSVFSD